MDELSGLSPIHNITHKIQVDVLRQPSGQEVTQKKTTYDRTYRYEEPSWA